MYFYPGAFFVFVELPVTSSAPFFRGLSGENQWGLCLRWRKKITVISEPFFVHENNKAGLYCNISRLVYNCAL